MIVFPLFEVTAASPSVFFSETVPAGPAPPQLQVAMMKGQHWVEPSGKVRHWKEVDQLVVGEGSKG